MRIYKTNPGRRILGLSLREHIGGRWAISLTGFLIVWPFTLITLASDITSMPEGNQWVQWTVAAIVSYLALGAVFLLASLTIFRNRRQRPVPILWVAALGAVASILRAEVNSTLVWQFDLISDYASELPVRLVTNVLLGAIMYPLLSLGLSLVSTFTSQRRLLLSQETELQGQRMRTTGESHILEAAIRASIAGEFAHVIEKGDVSAARNMSHQMWNSAAPEEYPRLRLTTLMRRALTRNPYATLPVLVIWGLSTWGSSIQALGAGPASVRMLLCFGVIIAAFTVGRKLTAAHPRHALAIFTISMAIVLSFIGPVTSFFFDPNFVEAVPVTIANCLWLLTIVITISFIRNSLTYSEEILDELQRDVAQSEVALLAAQKEEQRIRIELATLLHGSVQSRLLTAAAIMSQPDVSNRGVQITDALNNVTEILNAKEHVHTSLRSSLNLVADPWEPLMDIEISVDPDVSDSRDIHVFVHIAQEALSNSFRHGNARRVNIAIRSHPRETVMTIIDDGIFHTDQQSGLGTALIDSLAPGKWTRTSSSDGGCELTVVTSLPESPEVDHLHEGETRS